MVLLRHPKERLITRAKIEGVAQGKAEGIVEGKVEGANEMNAKWSAWNTRRIEHERRGDPFDEPPPSPEDYDRQDKDDANK